MIQCVCMASQLKKLSELAIASKVMALEPGKPFRLRTKGERVNALKTARILRHTGRIDFEVTTKADPEWGFWVHRL